MSDNAAQTVKIHYLNGDGGGFPTFIEVPTTQSVGEFVLNSFPDRPPNSLSIRIRSKNGVESFTPEPSYLFQEGDRLVITPLNLKGAR